MRGGRSSSHGIIRRATSSIPSERYQSVEDFAAAIRRRNHGRRIAICSLSFALLAGGMVLAWLLGRRLPEELAWDRLCGEVVATNVVQEETISVTWLDKNWLKIPAERRYRMVTNRVEVVPIQLNGVTNAFVNPVRLKSGRGAAVRSRRSGLRFSIKTTNFVQPALPRHLSLVACNDSPTPANPLSSLTALPVPSLDPSPIQDAHLPSDR